MAVIDIHTHAFPDELAPRAIASLEAECPWRAVAPGTVDALLRSMDESGVETAVLCTIATKPDQPKKILAWCDKIRSRRIVPLPSVHADTPDAAGWVKRFAEAGYVGIKLHPMYQSTAADDPRLDAVYGAAAEAGLFVECHCGLDIAYPPDDDRAAPRRYRAVLDRIPHLTLIATHLGGWRMWEEVESHLLGQDVYMETSFTFSELGLERAADMIRRQGVDRVLFGTDWPWAAQAGELERARQLPLEQDQIEAVLHRNAEMLLRL